MLSNCQLGVGNRLPPQGRSEDVIQLPGSAAMPHWSRRIAQQFFCIAAWFALLATYPALAIEPPSLQIIAQPRSGANERQIQAGDTLVTGDGVRIRVGTQHRAYVYVVAVGSSGSAVLLQPFSGRTQDALMAARMRRSIPSGSAVMPLDRHVGNETIIAVATLTPLQDPRAMVLEIESRSARGGVLTPSSLAEFGAVRTLTFQHNAAPVVGTARASSNSPGQPKPPLFGNQPSESGVLSGSGSRISAILSGKPASVAVPMTTAPAVPVPPKPAVQPASGNETPRELPADEPDSGSSLLGRLGAFFSAEPESQSRPQSQPGAQPQLEPESERAPQ